MIQKSHPRLYLAMPRESRVQKQISGKSVTTQNDDNNKEIEDNNHKRMCYALNKQHGRM